jgi:hypothetical protein
VLASLGGIRELLAGSGLRPAPAPAPPGPPRAVPPPAPFER